MATPSDKYIEIKNLFDPERVLKRLDNEFIDVMYPDRVSENSLIMLLDVGIDPNEEKDMIWLKELLDIVLPDIGETNYVLVPYIQSN